MRHFTPVLNREQIALPIGWINATKFKSRGNTVYSNGRNFEIVSKFQRNFSTFERIARIFLGATATVFTLGFALLSKSVKNLITKRAENMRFAIPVATNSIIKPIETNPSPIMIPVIKNPVTKHVDNNPSPISSPLNTIHYFSPATEPFFEWLDRIEKEKHISKSCKDAIKGSFKDCFTSCDGPSKVTSCTKEFEHYLEKEKAAGSLTQGNVDRIQEKLAQVIDLVQKCQAIKERARDAGFIGFYNHNDPVTEIFGNFYERSFVFEGSQYKCSEGAYQAQKFTDNPALMNQFCSLGGDPAFQLAASHKNSIRKDWHKVNLDIMRKILVAKFNNPFHKEMLLATGSSYLVERNPKKGRDTFWSDDSDGTGKNMLGKLLMQIRKELGGTGEVEPCQEYIQAIRPLHVKIEIVSILFLILILIMILI